LIAPARDCPFCPRLVALRHELRAQHPDWHNAPVPSFGAADGRVLVVGLAPGLKGANRTGRPFTGDYAGDLLYATLRKYGLARGDYRAPREHAPWTGDTLELVDARLSNAVRCLPPDNRPLPLEIRTCRRFLEAEIAAMPNLRAIVALGRVAHDAVLATLKQKASAFAFAHGRLHALPDGKLLADSYHCSRYNTNTGRLTTEMFEAVFAAVAERLARG
jgi:uracil-DNA glycosylase